MPIISQATTKQFSVVIPAAFKASDSLEKAKRGFDTVSWALISDSLRNDGFNSSSFKPTGKKDPKTGKAIENPNRIAIKAMIEGNYPQAARDLLAKDPKTLSEKVKQQRRDLTQRWTALLAKIVNHMAAAEPEQADKTDDEKALIMISTLIDFLKGEGRTWKKVKRVEAESFAIKTRAAIEGMKQ